MTGFPLGIERTRCRADVALESTAMDSPFLSPHEAAHRLGITVTTLYDWLGRSRYGLLEIRGHHVTIDYLQGGAKGQGRIRILASEVDRLNELMRVKPQAIPTRRPPTPKSSFPGITVPLGRPTTSS